ncbi:MAG TPA: Crp/Fnr family transcriptional regulator [Gemmatimonadaceae bacterium]|nr:Crp/Fnr family transcriptional regulator [Gemmatimonadaceae bacterium]
MPTSSGLALVAGDGVGQPASTENILLSLLPEEESAVIVENANRVFHDLRDHLFDVGDTIEHVYFPIGGMVSLVTTLSDGTSIEAATVGLEGFVGLPLFHGVQDHRTRGICQSEGELYEISAETFRKRLEPLPALNSLLHRYAQFSNEVVTQSSACNATHLIEQRCARWLLTTADGIGKTKFRLTQEFLSQMLAVRRPGVTVAMGALVRQGLIGHTYGVVDIVDVEGLKKTACECYMTLRAAQHDLLRVTRPATNEV